MSLAQVTDFSIDPFTTSGQQLAAILNRLHDAQLTTHSGAARPPYAKEGTLWIDNSATQLKLMLFDGTIDKEIGIGASTGGGGGGAPVGSIVAFMGGYFTDNINGGYTDVLGNDAAAVNGVVNSDGWYVCDGAAVNDPKSPIFNAVGRNLPNLTDARFIMGHSAASIIGGDNHGDHKHTFDPPSHTTGNPSTRAVNAHTLTIAEMPHHTHPLIARTGGTGTHVDSWRQTGPRSIPTDYAGGGKAHTHTLPNHTHTLNLPKMATTGADVTENRPKFLTCIYIIRVV